MYRYTYIGILYILEGNIKYIFIIKTKQNIYNLQ